MNKRKVQLATSFLAADLARLGEQVAEVEQAGADRIHVDVMDGHFVPNISGGAPVIRWLRQATHLPIEAHLMVLDPDALLSDFADAGADSLVIHWEGNNNLSRTLREIRVLRKRVGVALNPATPVSVLEEVLQSLDHVLLLTVTRGLWTKDLLPSTLAKISYARELIDEINPECELGVEGGINAETAPLVVDAGANVLVAGSAVFNQREGVIEATKRLLNSMDQGIGAEQTEKSESNPTT